MSELEEALHALQQELANSTVEPRWPVTQAVQRLEAAVVRAPAIQDILDTEAGCCECPGTMDKLRALL